MVDTCLEQDLGTFKGSCQDMVDQLEELRRRCAEAAHRAPITRLLFIITRCSRLVFTGMLAPSCCCCVCIACFTPAGQSRHTVLSLSPVCKAWEDAW